VVFSAFYPLFCDYYSHHMAEKTFGKLLQELRIEKGLSQEELAYQCSLDRTYISLLERGLRVPTIITLFKVAAALDIRPETFISRMEVNYQNLPSPGKNK